MIVCGAIFCILALCVLGALVELLDFFELVDRNTHEFLYVAIAITSFFTGSALGCWVGLTEEWARINSANRGEADVRRRANQADSREDG
jgi:hypothetical protein